MMRRNVLMGLLCLLMLGFASGCAFFKPACEVVFVPESRSIKILNTKDVDITLKNLKVAWYEGGGSFDVDKLVISDKSSPVIKENVQQMLAFAEQQRAANEGIIGSLTAIGNMVNVLSRALEAILRGSGVAIETPAGGGNAWLGTRPAG